MFNHMSGGTFRSKYAGLPGSLVAIRVDYGRNTSAFDQPAPDSDIAKLKRSVRHWKQGQRLGDKADWNGSTRDNERMRFPCRPPMHTLSEFQAVHLEYNYRAQTLPSINHSTLFVPKPSKMQIDKSIFLSPTEKEKLVPRCPATFEKLAMFPMDNREMPTAAREKGWNTSTELSCAAERSLQQEKAGRRFSRSK